MTAHKPPNATNPSEAVRHSGHDLTLAADFDHSTGLASFTTRGSAAQGESSALTVCRTLISHLNEVCGAKFTAVEAYAGGARAEQGVDCVARTDDGSGAQLKMQHTRADGRMEVWRLLGQSGSTTIENEPLDQALTVLKDAIDSKRNFAGIVEVVLVLDASSVGTGALQTVAEAFRTRHGEWAGAVGFRAIWLVGPISSLVFQLA